MTQVKFRVAAYTDAAGRFNPEAPRNGNEDNMFVNADLGAPEGSPFFESDKEMVLTDYGCLLVVADGMGGMNAGEVASEIAVNVVKGAFSKETVPHSAMEDSAGREKYLKKVVVMADEAVKSHANDHPECEGMGSTLVMAWLYDEAASIAWLGDSRIYLFREPEGLTQVSKDHSYVQELVDQGKITEEEAFTHPYNNVITRSLGDMSKKAVADSLTIKLFKRDILLLNSDGLSGVLHDDEIGQIIRANRETMSACRTELWKAAETAGWHDNVTAVLCEITEGEEYVVEPARPTEDPDEKKESDLDKTKINPEAVPPIAQTVGSVRPFIKLLPFILIALAVIVIIGCFYWRFNIQERPSVPDEVVDTTIVPSDSTPQVSVPVPEVRENNAPAKQEKQDEKKSSVWKKILGNSVESAVDTPSKVTPDTLKLDKARPGIEIDKKGTDTGQSNTPAASEKAEKEGEVKENQGVE